ncbi:MAG: SUMF1/EgtB/PvdO family nonheme iron enzyme [Bacteroidia bacterium]|nr:SUMF1/EgtB/PvdO family nonheme iron enzyme [Bacteroidia bacterium]
MKTKQIPLLACTALLLLTFFLNFSLSKKYKIHDIRKGRPPGTEKITATLFCDQEEVTNFSYQEYLYWTKIIFGKKSARYIAALPDTTVWNIFPCSKAHIKNYLMHPKYRYYPVVGVSYEQALNFTKWRSDRVMEFILIGQGYMKHVPAPDSVNYFTIERYYEGKIKVLDEKKPVYPYYPEYRLPSVEEWKMISSLSDSLFIASVPGIGKNHSLSYYDSEKHINCDFLINPTLICKNDSMIQEPIRKTTYFKKRTKLKWLVDDIRGNVSEMSSVKGVSLGGDWNTPYSKIMAISTSNYSKPDVYTGFRNVCEWKVWAK